MTVKKRRTHNTPDKELTVQDKPITPNEFDDDGAPNDEFAVLQAVNAEADADTIDAEFSVRVYEHPDRLKGETKLAWLPNMDCSVGDLDGIRQRLFQNYGAGTFQIRVRRQNRIFRLFDIRIKAPPGYVAPGRAEQAPQPQPQAELVQLLARMNERLDRIERGATAPATTADPMALFEKGMAFAERMLGARQAPAIADPMALFERGMEFAERIAKTTGDGDSGSIVGIVKDVLASPIVQQIATNFAQSLPAQPEAQPATVAQLPHRPQPQRAAPVAVSDPLTTGINYLVSQAAAGTQPDLLASYVLQNVPAHILDQLEDTADPVTFLAERFPQIGPYRPWFVALLNSLYEDATQTEADHGKPTGVDATASPDSANASGPKRDAGNA